jgi:hypothetical protein
LKILLNLKSGDSLKVGLIKIALKNSINLLVHIIHIIQKNEYKGFTFNLRIQYVKDVEMDIYIESNDEIINCAVILVNLKDKTALLQSLDGNINCANPQLPKTGKGTILMEFIKYSIINKLLKSLNIQYIDTDDNSHVYCVPQKKLYRFKYIKLYTLMSGMPWYYKFGFINNDDYVNIKINDNIQIMNKLLTKDLDINKINNTKLDNTELDYLINFFNTNSNLLLKNTIRKLFNDNCILLNKIYNDIYNIIGLYDISEHGTMYRYDIK